MTFLHGTDIHVRYFVFHVYFQKERKYVKELSHCKTARAVMYEVCVVAVYCTVSMCDI